MKTLDEYLKRYTVSPKITKQETQEKTIYKILGFYKETTVQDTPIGRIPKEWTISKLGRHIKEFVRGVSFKNTEISFIPTDDSIPILRATNLGEHSLLLDNLIYINRNRVKPSQIIKKNDIIIVTSSGSRHLVGRSLLIKELVSKQIAIGAFLGILRIDSRVLNPTFIYHLLKSNIFKRYLINRVSGTNIKNLRKEFLVNFTIPLPPLEEQWGIAEVLSTVDRAIEATERVIEKLERLKRGLMQELLTKGIGHKEYKQTPIGKIPKQWEVVSLSRIARIIMGQSPPSSTYNEDGVGLPFLQGKAEFGRIYPTPELYTSKPIKVAERGDLLISVRAPVGDVNIAPYKLCIGRGLTAIRFNNDSAITLFYFYYFSLIKPKLEAMGKGSTFKAITKKDLESFLVPRPPIEEQKMIANTLFSIDQWIISEEERKGKLERLKRGLMELLLTGRVRVRVERVS